MVQNETLQLAVICVFTILVVPILSNYLEDSGAKIICSKETNFVIEKENLKQIRGCREEIISNEKGVIHRIQITSGIGQDCMSGCFYDVTYATVVKMNGVMSACVSSDPQGAMSCRS